MSETQQLLEKIPRKRLNIALLSVAAFFSQASLFCYYGLIGIQAEHFGAPGWVQTLLPIAPSIIAIFLLVIIGIYADRTGLRKHFVLAGLAIDIAFNVLLAFAGNWPELLIFRIIGGGIMTCVLFLFVVFFVYQMPKRRGAAVGLFMGLSTAGSSLFAILGGGLAQTMGFSIVYLVGALLGALSFVFLLPVSIPRIKATNVSLAQFGKAIKTRGVYYPGFVFLVIQLGFQGLFSAASLILVLPQYGFLASLTFVGLLFSVNAIVTAIAMFLGGAITDKIEPRFTMVIGAVLAGIALITVPLLSTNSLIFAVLVWIATFFWGLTYSPPPTVATASVGHEFAGVAVNTVTMLASIGSVLGGIAVGIYLTLGWQTAIAIMGVLLIIGGVLSLGIPKLRKPEKH